MDYLTALICPWWEMTDRLSVGPYVFEPLDIAMESHPTFADALRHNGSVYCTGNMFPSEEDADAFMRGHEVPMRPQRVRPTVLVLQEDQSVSDAQAVVDRIAFACMSQNDGLIYTNAAVFDSKIVRLVSPWSEFVVGQNRRMNGGSTNLYSIRSRIETKPEWCGEYQRPNVELLEALLSVPAEYRGPFDRALGSLRHATRDVGYIPVDIERAFYALVVTQLFSDELPDDGEATHAAALHRLLDPHVNGNATNIVTAYRSMKLVRNAKWHAKPRKRPPYPFEQQDLVPLNLIYFRVVESIIIARLVDLGSLDRFSKAAAKVAAIDAWLGDVNALDGQYVTKPTNGNEFVELRDKVKAARSISKRWMDSWLALYREQFFTSSDAAP